MDTIKQIGILLLLCLVGEGISLALPVPFPGSVIAMLLLFLVLATGLLKEERIAGAADFLLKNMSFFFLPAGVGILKEYAGIRDSVWVLLLICIVTLVLTFAATALTVRAVTVLMNRGGGGERHG